MRPVGRDRQVKGVKMQGLTKEQLNAIRKEWAELDRQRMMGKPSSKLGRDLYYSKVGLFGFPFAVVEMIGDWFKGSEVWFSDSGWKCYRNRKTRRFHF